MSQPRRLRQTTATHLVFELLKADPYLTARAICTRLPQCSMNQILAALSHMRDCHAVAFETDAGEAYWYATPETDQRASRVQERTPEEKPRRKRRPKAKKPAWSIDE